MGGGLAPSKTPRAIVDKMSGAVAAALKTTNVRKRYEDLLVETVGSSPAELDKFFDEQLVFNKEAIKRAKIEMTE